MERGLYRKLPKKQCVGCDHPAYAPCKNVNSRRACIKCLKERTKRRKFVPEREE